MDIFETISPTFLLYLLEIWKRGLISDPQLNFDINWSSFDIFDIA
jgi:hypothetical protein